MVDVGVGEQPDAVGFQDAEGSLGLGILDLLLEHIPADVRPRDEQIADYQRVVFNVGGPDIEHPGDLVKGGQQDCVAVPFLQEGADPGELFPAALAGVDGEYRGLRYTGAVFPEAAQQVRNADDGPRERLREIGPDAQSVHGDDAVAAELSLQPFRDQDLVRDPGLVEDDARAGELLLRLDEVAGVGPQAGVVQGDHDIARLAGEAGEPFHLLPALGGVFALVGIRAGDDHGVPALGAHQGAQEFDLVCNKVCHIRRGIRHSPA